MIALFAMGVACSSSPENTATEVEREGNATDEPAHYIGISAVEGFDGNILTVRTDPLPVDRTASGCSIEATPRVQETRNRVMVFIDLSGDVGERPYFEGCDLATQSLDVMMESPVGTRHVTDPFSARFWQENGRWVGCNHIVVTCVTDPANCDNGTLRATVSNADVPRGFNIDSRCEEPFAVTDIDVGAGACPADDSDPNHCAGERIRRTYWHIENEAWVSISHDSGPGCGSVQDVAPEFPTHLCADLLLVPGSG